MMTQLIMLLTDTLLIHQRFINYTEAIVLLKLILILKPETTDTVEVGLKKQFSPKLYSSLSVYQAKSKDLIDYDYLDNGKKQYMNLSSVKRQGIELMLDYKMDDKFSTFDKFNITK